MDLYRYKYCGVLNCIFFIEIIFFFFNINSEK